MKLLSKLITSIKQDTLKAFVFSHINFSLSINADPIQGYLYLTVMFKK
jgi:hypothetical protein